MITEIQLDVWVRDNAREAQGVIVELIWRLVAASCPIPNERRFPLGDSINQHGPDGFLNVDTPFKPFVPAGISFWEIGTGLKAHNKATSDYKGLTTSIPEAIRHESTFVFVTPLSAGRVWEYTWKQDAQAKWIEEHKLRNEWKDVLVIDGSILIDWLSQFPAVELWLASKMGRATQQIEIPDLRWNVLKSIGEPPQLTPKIFLMNRESACLKLKNIFDSNNVKLKFETNFPEQVLDFVAAYIANLDEETRVEIAGRCLIITDINAWNNICEQYKNCILIATPTVDLSGHEGAVLVEKALKAGHSIIYSGLQGGLPDKNTVSLPQLKVYQLSKMLEEAGYNEERAQILAKRSNGNLSTLLNLLQNVSLIPEWAQGSDTIDLPIAIMLGAWDENKGNDRIVAEILSTKSYSKWIGKIRKLVIRSDSPLTLQDGKWKFNSRYEGWYALGPQIYDEHLDRLQNAIVTVLREKDPKFDLPANERFAAQVHKKILSHSQLLRIGLAESLALLGSHPKALTHVSFGKADATAIISVRNILKDADWVLWASLNDVMPLLAEAAPNEFLNFVDAALHNNPCPFDILFSQEGSGTTGSNYITGLLWALETLAWDPNCFIKVVSILGMLATRDPGGNWANRPINSLTTILLPWFPQTCASIDKRRTAITTLYDEQPNVAWKVLLGILPGSHTTTMYTRRPAWKDVIPENWSNGVKHVEYIDQVNSYADLAIQVAKSNVQRLTEIIERLDDLPPSAHNQLFIHLESNAVLTLPEIDRLHIWIALINLVSRHRKFADAEWAMDSNLVDRINTIAERLAPKSPHLLYKRLFTERYLDLFDEKGNYDKQLQQLESRRQQAVQKISEEDGTQAVIDFAVSVESPWQVGNAYGFIAPTDADKSILPILLDSSQEALIKFVHGFIIGRLNNQKWSWVDGIDTNNWTQNQIAQFLSYLPFTHEVWERSARLLTNSESLYWTRTTANPYESQKNLEIAIDKLIKYDRPFAAIRCLHLTIIDKQPLDSEKVVSALMAALDSSESKNEVNTGDIVDIIMALQTVPESNKDDVLKIEWAYLTLLEYDRDASPKLLEQKLATDPDFFCEMMSRSPSVNRTAYSTEQPTDQEKSIVLRVYRLLSNWRIPPGWSSDKCYNGDALVSWIDKVKKKCSEMGCLDTALHTIGNVLIYTPSDTDGLWINRSVATVLNAEDNGEMRVGFSIGLYNSQEAQVHMVDPTGKPEREYAIKYRKQAEEIEAAGYHRLANTLRELAEEFERNAERIASRGLFDE